MSIRGGGFYGTKNGRKRTVKMPFHARTVTFSTSIPRTHVRTHVDTSAVRRPAHCFTTVSVHCSVEVEAVPSSLVSQVSAVANHVRRRLLRSPPQPSGVAVFFNRVGVVLLAA